MLQRAGVWATDLELELQGDGVLGVLGVLGLPNPPSSVHNPPNPHDPWAVRARPGGGGPSHSIWEEALVNGTG